MQAIKYLYNKNILSLLDSVKQEWEENGDTSNVRPIGNVVEVPSVVQILKTEDGDDIKITISLSDQSDQLPDTTTDVLNASKDSLTKLLKATVVLMIEDLKIYKLIVDVQYYRKKACFEKTSQFQLLQFCVFCMSNLMSFSLYCSITTNGFIHTS